MDVAAARLIVLFVTVTLQVIAVVHILRRRPNVDQKFVNRMQIAATVGWVAVLALWVAE